MLREQRREIVLRLGLINDFHYLKPCGQHVQIEGNVGITHAPDAESEYIFRSPVLNLLGNLHGQLRVGGGRRHIDRQGDVLNPGQRNKL